MAAVPALPGALSAADLVEIAGEPRVFDLRLAERLGFSDTHKIRNLIRRHRPALERFGEISATVAEKAGPKGRGRPGKAFWLNKRQALYLCAKSEAALAIEITIEMVEVFDAWLAGTPATVDLAAVETRLAGIETRLAALEADRMPPAEPSPPAAAPQAERRYHPNPTWSRNREVRLFLAGLHRRCTVDECRAAALDRFGPLRTPSRSAIHRYWQRLDHPAPPPACRPDAGPRSTIVASRTTVHTFHPRAVTGNRNG